MGVLYPAILMEAPDMGRVVHIFITQFIFILAITLPFDIRDYYRDLAHPLWTIPGLIGIDRTKKLAKLEDQLSNIQLYHYIKWFLAGSGVLLVGFIIGFSAKRQRRRPSLL